MYTILENARIVIALLKEHNIKHVVISPGGSNIPIVQGIQQDPFFTCYSVVDERSAMYFAIGLYLELGVPIATSCTSAQATRNYIPGLTEAYYKRVPILAITMSKHPKYLGQEYMQCPIQTSLPVDAVKKSYSLPCIANSHDRQLCVRMANEAILELTHHKCGPVQLNIEVLDSETWVMKQQLTLPRVRRIERIAPKDDFTVDLTNKRVMVLIGEHRPFTPHEMQVFSNFVQDCNAMFYANHISNFHCGDQPMHLNLAAACATRDYFKANIMPDILITLGGITGDYYIYDHLASTPEGTFEHWRINPDGEVVDTYNKLTKVFEMDFEDFSRHVTCADKTTAGVYYSEFKDLVDRCDLNVEVPLSNLYMAQQLHHRIPCGSSMHFAILNSLRVWSLFPLHNINCHANVGAFGIDGCLSTLIGQSVARPDALMFHVTGDLSFYYDMNALGIRHRGNNLRILLVNNNGGVEFKLGDLQDRTDVGSYIAADNHFRDAEGWARTNGFIYLSARTKEEANSHIDRFIAPSDAPILLEVFTTPEDERAANRTFIEENRMRTANEQSSRAMHEMAKSLLGETAYKHIKKLIKPE